MALFVKGIINYVRDGVQTILAQSWAVYFGSPFDSSIVNNRIFTLELPIGHRVS